MFMLKIYVSTAWKCPDILLKTSSGFMLANVEDCFEQWSLHLFLLKFLVMVPQLQMETSGHIP